MTEGYMVLPDHISVVRDSTGRAIGLAGHNAGTYIPRFQVGERITATRMVELLDRIQTVERQTAALTARLMLERSKWCHHCGAPWYWARPTCRYCGTARPPDR